MKNLAIALLITALGYGLSAAQAPAGQPGQTAPETKKEMKAEKKHMKKAKMNVCKGKVEAVDAAANTITVKEHKGMSMVLPITAETKIMKGEKAAAITDIMVGDMVHIRYEGEMAAPIVKMVKIEKPSMKKDKMEKKAAGKGEMKK